MKLLFSIPIAFSLLAISAYAAETEVSFPPAEWLSCTKSTDCAVIQNYCAWEAVNAKNAENAQRHYEKEYKIDRYQYDCTEEFSAETQPKAKCLQNRCTLPEVK